MKEVYIPDLGRVYLSKRRQSKRITVRYDPSGKIRVSLPPMISYGKGIDFVECHKSTIRKKIIKLQADRARMNYQGFRTKKHRVIFQPENRKYPACQISESRIIVRYPENILPGHPLVQQITRRGIVEALRMEAREYLPQRLSTLAKEYDFSFNRLTVKNVRTLWGSCASKNNINLNIHLMRLPDHLIDYVLIHELCHTVHKNHSRDFWNLLGKLTRNRDQELRKELKRYTPWL